MGQTLFVGRFEQSRPAVTVNFNGTTDHAIRKLVEFHLRALRVLRALCGCLSFRRPVLNALSGERL